MFSKYFGQPDPRFKEFFYKELGTRGPGIGYISAALATVMMSLLLLRDLRRVLREHGEEPPIEGSPEPAILR